MPEPITVLLSAAIGAAIYQFFVPSTPTVAPTVPTPAPSTPTPSAQLVDVHKDLINLHTDLQQISNRVREFTAVVCFGVVIGFVAWWTSGEAKANNQKK